MKNYLRMANDILDIAANKDEYKVDTYLANPRVTVKDEDGYIIFHYDKSRRSNINMYFKYDRKVFHYNFDSNGEDYWFISAYRDEIEDSNEDEFFQALTEFTEQLSGGEIY